MITGTSQASGCGPSHPTREERVMCNCNLPPYKPHLACFACRKSFKRRLASDIGHRGSSHPPLCPHCRRQLADMGLNFKAPKKNDLRAWAVASSLFEAGETFESRGCCGPTYRPREPRMLAQYFDDRHRELSAHLSRWVSDRDEPRRAEAIENLRTQLARLEAARSKLSPSTESSQFGTGTRPWRSAASSMRAWSLRRRSGRAAA